MQVQLEVQVKEPCSPLMTVVVAVVEVQVQVEVQVRPCASLERQLDSTSDCHHRHRLCCLSRRRHRRPLSTVEMRTRETKVCRPWCARRRFAWT